jgi:hypothetical protein
MWAQLIVVISLEESRCEIPPGWLGLRPYAHEILKLDCQQNRYGGMSMIKKTGLVFVAAVSMGTIANSAMADSTA